jgi:hypothetical protein
MPQVKITTEIARHEDYKTVASQSVYRLETCLEELELAIRQLKQAADDPGRKLLIAATASVDVVASISRSIEGQLEACLARTSD